MPAIGQTDEISLPVDQGPAAVAALNVRIRLNVFQAELIGSELADNAFGYRSSVFSSSGAPMAKISSVIFKGSIRIGSERYPPASTCTKATSLLA